MNLDYEIFDEYCTRGTFYKYHQSYDATWCPICDKQVSSKCRDTDELLQHIRQCHPTKSCNNPEYQEPEGGLNASEKLLENTFSKDPTCSAERKVQRRVYATRVDTWKTHNEKKVCPKCQKEVTPTLHSRGNKLTTTHVAALWLLGCWPFCFAPLMTKRAKKFRMVCPLCGYLYGIFEDTNNGLSARAIESEDLHARLSSPPENFREQALRDTDDKNLLAVNLETWKWHSKTLLCPSCNQEAAPLLFLKQHKFTSSHLGAMCLLGCWPLCFMPLTTSRDKQIRMVCPLCGYDYGTRVEGKRSSLQSCAKQLPETHPTTTKSTEIKSTTCFGYPERKLHFEQIPGNVHKWGLAERRCRLENNPISSVSHSEKRQHRFIDSERSECQFCASRSISKLQNSGIDGYYDYDCQRNNNGNYYHDHCND